jgi:hypothetical protein
MSHAPMGSHGGDPALQRISFEECCAMAYYIVKIAVTTILIVLISEISKRHSFAAAVLASIPLVSVIAMVWLYVDTRDVHSVAALASNIFWLVIPSLALFISLPILLKSGVNFYASLAISVAITSACYYAMVLILPRIGINL